MELMKNICSVTILCCICLLSPGWAWLCEHGATRWADTRTFFGGSNFVSITLPCRYKMANIRCGSDQTEVYAENSLDFHHGVAYVTAVTVNVTTINDDNSTTYQILTVTNVTLKEYLDSKDLAKTGPWAWNFEGSQIDEAKKVKGYAYTESYGSAQYAHLRVGKLTIDFQDVRPKEWVRANPMKPILKILCFGAELEAFEDYPQTVCGGPDNKKKDMDILEKEIAADPHHLSSYFRDNYLILAKQHVQQTNLLCEQASEIVSGDCTRLGDMMYAAYRVYSNDYRTCMDQNHIDPLNAYVASLHVLCGTDEMSSAETCQTLIQLSDTCGAGIFAHKTMEEYLSLAKCPAKTEQSTTTTSTTMSTIDVPGSRVCRSQDKKMYGPYRSKQAYPGFTSTFVDLNTFRIELPCRYKMADIQCGDAKAVVYTDHALDVDLLAYINKVTVKITTTAKDGELITQTNKLTNGKLRKYIETGDFTTRLWKWTYAGEQKPKARDRIIGQFNNVTKSGELIRGELNITYAYINPRDSNRSSLDYLVISCSDQGFTLTENFPQNVCGGPLDARSSFTLDAAIGRSIHADPHHEVEHDVVVLMHQNLKQSKSLCKQLLDLTTGNCSDLGDKLYECDKIFRPPLYYLSSPYGECIRNNSINPFEVYLACLRGLCGSNVVIKDDTCRTLQQVHAVCGDVDNVHMNLSQLLARANCTVTSK